MHPNTWIGVEMKSTRRKPTNKKRWVAGVTTDSTHPKAGLFTKSAVEIARNLASKRVSPKGPASGMRMLNYFINRGRKNLSKTRRAELERAKKLLSKKIHAKKAAWKKRILNIRGTPAMPTPFTEISTKFARNQQEHFSSEGLIVVKN